MAPRPEPGLRVFFALWPPAPVARALFETAQALRAHTGGRCMAEETLHQTLAFLGNVPAPRLAELQALAASLHRPGCSLSLDRLGYWPHNQILWAGPGETPEPLGELAATLGKGLAVLGFPVERRPFRLHVTLLRKAQRAPLATAIPPLAWPVRDFVLVASRLEAPGPRYQVLGRWELAEPAAG